MDGVSWDALYHSELQGLWSLLVVPLAFLAWRAAVPTDPARAEVPAAAGFVSRLTLFFAFATMVDPICTGPLVRSDALAGTVATDLVPLFFVLLGDLRVLLLAIGVARPDRSLGANLRWAVGTTLIVPVVSWPTWRLLAWLWPELDSQVLWMLYELGFLLLCVFLSRAWVPRILAASPEQAGYLRALFGYSAAYYALWLTADVLIVVGGLDLGWAIRIVPNQLYYAFWVPFAYWRFFDVRPTGLRPATGSASAGPGPAADPSARNASR